MLFNLEGKTALITGAGGGIGKAIAKSLHEQGASVCLASFTSEKAVREVANELKERAYVLPSMDISKEDNIKIMVEEAEKFTGKIDILINNAGITKDTLSIRMSKEEWDQVISINLTTPFLLSKAILMKMMKRRYGRIVNISSIVGAMGNIGQANYAASKGGLVAMTKTLAREFAARGITVNAVAPGFIATKMTDVLPEDQQEKLLSSIPLNRMGTPEEIAAAVAFLSSDEAGYITGETIHVNGGMVMI
jgi:3-oxoacyl-[acyl-carrier protein] reductase